MTGKELKLLRRLLFIPATLSASEIGGYKTSRYWRRIEAGEVQVPAQIIVKMHTILRWWHNSILIGFHRDVFEMLELSDALIDCLEDSVSAYVTARSFEFNS